MMFDTAIEQAAAIKGKAEMAVVKLGTVTSVSGGRASVQHYGESEPSSKQYTYIDGYFPEVGDKVAMLPQGNTYIIIGKVMDSAPVEKYATKDYVDTATAGLLPVAYKNKLEDSDHSTENLTFSGYVLLPTTDDKDSLGSSAKNFKELYVKKLILNGTEYTGFSMDRIEVKSGGTTYSLTASVSSSTPSLIPSANDKWILGSKTYQLKESWLGLFRGKWKSGQNTERQISWNSSNAIVPDTTNAIDLGDSSHIFAEIFADSLIGVKSKYQSSSTNNMAWGSGTDYLPNNTNAVNLGSSSKQFNKVYAKEFYINGTLIDISGISTDELKATQGSSSYTLKLSVVSGGTTLQYEKLEPSVNGKFDLGSSSYQFRKLYLEGWTDGTRTLSYNSQHDLVPDTNNALSLGTSSMQFKNIYGQNIYVNGTAVSSDRNKKKNIEALDDRYNEFFKGLRPVSYEYKDIPGKHTGFIAQEVEDAAEEAGLNAGDVGVVIEPESNQYYLAYQEIIAVQTKMIQDLMGKVENLEARVKKLEAERS